MANRDTDPMGFLPVPSIARTDYVALISIEYLAFYSPKRGASVCANLVYRRLSKKHPEPKVSSKNGSSLKVYCITIMHIQLHISFNCQKKEKRKEKKKNCLTRIKNNQSEHLFRIL